MIITISGESCTGTTTLTRNLSRALNIHCFMAGELFREILASQSKSVMDMIEEEKNDFTLDKLVDGKMIMLLQNEKNAIVEGRVSGFLAWKYNIPSKRILLTSTIETKTQRLMMREKEKTPEVAMKKILTRDAEDWKRYQKLYQMNPEDQETWYTLALATDHDSIDEVLAKAVAHVQS